MAQKRLRLLLGAFAACLALAAFPAEREVKTPQKSWSSLSAADRQVVSPLATDWDKLPGYQQQRLISAARQYPKMQPIQQERFQAAFATGLRDVYEHILYDGLQHTHMASLPGMWERTVTISGISKTYSATGWRVGYVISHSGLMSAIRKCHDYMVVAAPTPFQMGAVAAIAFPIPTTGNSRDSTGSAGISC